MNAKSRLSACAGEMILLFTAMIWGGAFACQRLGMRSLGPYAYNAITELLGVATLGAVMLARWAWRRSRGGDRGTGPNVDLLARSIRGGAVAGGVFFLAASFQQHGLMDTSAGNSGFLTSLYVVLVPILGIALGRKPPRAIWAGALLAIAGVYCIAGTGGGWLMRRGDWLTLASAFFWAVQITVLDRLAPRTDALVFAATQFFVASIPAIVFSLATETTTTASIGRELAPVLYSGIASFGIGFTCQVIGQKRARASRASIIMSTEAFFAALGGVVMLGESVSWKMVLGAALMFVGIIVARAERNQGQDA